MPKAKTERYKRSPVRARFRTTEFPKWFNMSEFDRWVKLYEAIPQELRAEALRMVRAGKRKSHQPYSNFTVRSVTLTTKGELVDGGNVENASYGLTVCAEVVSLSHAAACAKIGRAGRKASARMIVVYAPIDQIITPCGRCRQFIREFSKMPKNTLVWCVGKDKSGKNSEYLFSLEFLLPFSFGGEYLK